MWDQYDLRFGLQKDTKQLALYYLWLFFINILLMYHFLDWKAFTEYQIPANNQQLIGGVAGISFTGMMAYSIRLFFKVRRDVRMFREERREWLFIGDIIKKSQKEKVLEKIYTRIEMYSIVSRPKDIDLFERLNEKTWLFYVKLLGTKEEVDAKIFYLQRLREKVEMGKTLTKDQKEYLNDLLFSDEDYRLLQRIQKDLEKAKKRPIPNVY